MTRNLMHQGVISMDRLRIDSTVVASHIAPPSDSQLLNDGVRVISRLLAKSKAETGGEGPLYGPAQGGKVTGLSYIQCEKSDEG